MSYLTGTAEPLVQQLLPFLVGPGDVVLDVGANVGFFTVGISRLVGSAGLVIAFEPLSENAMALEHNRVPNGFRNVRCVQAAIGAQDTKEPLLLGGGSTVAKLQHTGAREDTSGAVEVPVIALDSYFRQDAAPLPQLIKMDIEGAEGSALLGARELLLSARPLILCELHSTHSVVGDLMSSVDYSLFCVEHPEQALDQMHWNAHVLAFPNEVAVPCGVSAMLGTPFSRFAKSMPPNCCLQVRYPWWTNSPHGPPAFSHSTPSPGPLWPGGRTLA